MTMLLLAALLTVLLAASSLNSEVFRKGRFLDPTRTVMDIGGLVEPETFVASQTWSETVLARWSTTHHVRYRRVDHDKLSDVFGVHFAGQQSLRLEKADIKSGKRG